MNTYFTHSRNLIIAAMTLATIFIGQTVKASTVNDRIEYRGRIMVNSTTPATGDYTMRISFWTDEDMVPGVDIDPSGTLVGETWQEVKTVTIDSEGYFVTEIGDATPLPTVLDQAQYKYFQAELKTLAGADSTYTLLDPYLTNDDVDRRLIPVSGFARNAELIDGRSLGNTAGDVPFLDDISGQLDPSIIPTQSWHSPVTNTTALTGISSPSAGDRAYVIAESEVYTWDGSAWVADSAALSAQIGDRTYTQDSFVNDGESLTQSVDALDQNLQTVLTSIGNPTYTEDNFVTDNESVASSIDALDQQLKDTTDDTATNTAAIATNTTNIATNVTSITNNTNAINTANTNIGNQTYTEDNYVTDGETVTASVDALDQQLKDVSDDTATNTAAIASNTTNITNNTNAINALASGITWKAPVANFAALNSTYGSSPANEGITAYVIDQDQLYTLDGTGTWIQTGGASAPNATTSVPGIVTLSGDGGINTGVVQGNDSRVAQIGTNTTNITNNTTAINNANTNLGNLIYTEDNYVNDNENITTSIDALDQQLKDTTDDTATNTASITTNTTNITNATTNLGNLTYTEDNYVTDLQSVTNSIDALDQQVKDNADNISANGGNTGDQLYTEENYVADLESFTDSIDAIDIQVKDHNDAILINQDGVSGDFDTYILP